MVCGGWLCGSDSWDCTSVPLLYSVSDRTPEGEVGRCSEGNKVGSFFTCIYSVMLLPGCGLAAFDGGVRSGRPPSVTPYEACCNFTFRITRRIRGNKGRPLVRRAWVGLTTPGVDAVGPAPGQEPNRCSRWRVTALDSRVRWVVGAVAVLDCVFSTSRPSAAAHRPPVVGK